MQFLQACYMQPNVMCSLVRWFEYFCPKIGWSVTKGVMFYKYLEMKTEAPIPFEPECFQGKTETV